MRIEHGCTYQCENGYVVTLESNKLPYYKFSCTKASVDGVPVVCEEVFTENGIAYHNDCGYNIISKL